MPGRACIALALFAATSLTFAAATARADDADETAPGHLRVHALCAEGMATPKEGLKVSVDGVAQPDRGIDEDTRVYLNGDGTLSWSSIPLDVGFAAPAGHHTVRIEANDCAPIEDEVEIGQDVSTKIDASLAISNPDLMGPTGAPNGFVFFVGGYGSSLPAVVSKNAKNGDSLGGRFTLDGRTIHGLDLSGGYVHRNFVMMFDLQMGGGSPGGLGSNDHGSTTPFQAETFGGALAARIGARFPMENVAFAAGLGLGGALWAVGDHSQPLSNGATNVAATFSATRFTYDVPLWASVTVKPSCDVGLQFGAEYHWDPSDGAGNTMMFDAGLLIEPNGACGREPSISYS